MSTSTSPPLAAESAPDLDDVVEMVTADEAADRAEETLTALVESVGGELRGPQVAMARSVASALADEKHLAVQAPTGTGKSFAYLVPAAHHAKDVGGTVIVATATKTLQAQLVESDLETIKGQFPNLRFALLKGRGNFVCHLEARKAMDESQGAFFTERIDEGVWDDLLRWMEDTETGDRDEAPDGVTDAMWSKVSVGSDGCVGSKCSFYNECFSERARDQARAADVVVTNHHMLLIEKVGGAFNVLPYHDAVIVDEGHKLLDTASNIAGIALKPARFKWLGDFGKSLLGDDSKDVSDGLYEKESRLEFVFEGLVDAGRIDPSEGNLAATLSAAQSTVSKAISAAKRLRFSSSDDKEAEARRDQFVQACDGTHRDLGRLLESRDDDVVWVAGGDRRQPVLRMAPLDLASTLKAQLFSDGPVVLTSATLTTGGKFEHLIDELGLSTMKKKVDTLSVPSPFDYASQSVLYVPMHLPQPKGGFQSAGYQKWEQGALDTTLELVKATEGRALLLFTSWKRLNDTADFLELKVPYRVMRQGDAPPARLIERLREDPHSILCATASFWEGVSVDGDAVSLVVVDKLPFGRRDDPLLSAMRDLADESGGNGFRDVDLPRTSRMLAQGVGRLIRTVDDFGVCAILDNRVAQTEALARKKGGRPGYGDMLLADLPPMRKTATLHADDGVMPEDLTAATDDELAALLETFNDRKAGPPAADWAKVRLEMSRRERG